MNWSSAVQRTTPTTNVNVYTTTVETLDSSTGPHPLLTTTVDTVETIDSPTELKATLTTVMTTTETMETRLTKRAEGHTNY